MDDATTDERGVVEVRWFPRTAIVHAVGSGVAFGKAARGGDVAAYVQGVLDALAAAGRRARVVLPDGHVALHRCGFRTNPGAWLALPVPARPTNPTERVCPQCGAAGGFDSLTVVPAFADVPAATAGGAG